MTECTQFEQEIIEIITGDGIASKKLEAHLKDCHSCRDILEMHGNFELFDIDSSPVAEPEFARVRRNVLHQLNMPSIQHREPAPPQRRVHWWPTVLAAAAAVFFGFMAGARLGAPDFIEEVRRLTHEPQTGDPPLSFTDVTFNPLEDGRVAASFNVSTYMETVADKDDPLFKELMVQSLLASSAMNTRLEAIRYSEDLMDPRIREALIVSLKGDESLAVRLKAMSRLASEIDQPEVHDAFIWVLRHEREVSLRLQAIDYLSGEQSDSTQLQNLLEELKQENGSALPLLIRARDTDLQ